MAVYLHVALVPGGAAGRGVGSVGSLLTVSSTKPLKSFRSTQISIALALPLVHKITGCPALSCTFRMGFHVVGSVTCAEPMIHKSCPMAVVNLFLV